MGFEPTTTSLPESYYFLKIGSGRWISRGWHHTNLDYSPTSVMEGRGCKAAGGIRTLDPLLSFFVVVLYKADALTN